jgi:predicted RND superfamily exporter protein
LWLAALVVFVPSAYRTASLYRHLSSDLEQLLPPDAPSVKALGELRQRMVGLQHLGVLVDFGPGGDVAGAERLVDQLAERVRHYPPQLVRRVRTGVQEEKRFLEHNGAIYIDLPDLKVIHQRLAARKRWEFSRQMDIDLDDTPPPPIDFSDIQKKYLSAARSFGHLDGDRFTSRQLGVTLLLIEVGGGFSTGLATAHDLARRLQADLAALGLPRPGLRVGLTGEVAIQLEEVSGLQSDLTVASLVVVAGVMAVLLLFYRWASSLPLLFLPLMVATTGAFALASLLGVDQLNSNTAFLGSIIIGNGINFGVILLARYAEARRRGADVEQALIEAVGGTRAGTLVAALGASASYGSLVITRFRGFRQFGLIGGLGMVLCWAAPFLLVPWLATRLDRRPLRPRPERHGFTGPVATLVARWPVAIAVVGAALTIAAVSLTRHALDPHDIETDFSKLRRRDTWTKGERYWGAKMDAMLGRNLAPTVFLADRPDQARALGRRLKEESGRAPLDELVADVRSPDDVLPPDQPARLAELDAIRRLLSPATRASLPPERQEDVDRFLASIPPRPLGELDLPSGLKTGFEQRDGHLGPVVLLFPRPGRTWQAERLERFVGQLRQLGGGARLAGALPISADIVASIQHDGPIATGASLAGVMLLVVLMFRGRRPALYVIGSLVVGVLWMVALSYVLRIKINFANFIAFPITFGIGVDYAVNLMSRYVQERGAVRTAITSTGAAVALCSATTIIGYSSLLIAQNRGLTLFGLLAVMGEVTCLTVALVVLPAVLLLLGRHRVG